MAEASGREEYDKLVEIAPLKVWTPDGYRAAPTRIDMELMGELTLTEAVFEAGRRKPRQRILTCGEWHVVRDEAERTCPELERSMTTGAGYRTTSTILDYEHGKVVGNVFHGLLIQNPEIVQEERHGPMLAVDENGIIKARDIWEMALPFECGYEATGIYAVNLPPELDTFLNTIYGMEDARKRVKYAFIGISHRSRPPADNMILRRGWYNDSHASQCVRVIGSCYEGPEFSRNGRPRAAVDA